MRHLIADSNSFPVGRARTEGGSSQQILVEFRFVWGNSKQIVIDLNSDSNQIWKGSGLRQLKQIPNDFLLDSN